MTSYLAKKDIQTVMRHKCKHSISPLLLEMTEKVSQCLPNIFTLIHKNNKKKTTFFWFFELLPSIGNNNLPKVLAHCSVTLLQSHIYYLNPINVFTSQWITAGNTDVYTRPSMQPGSHKHCMVICLNEGVLINILIRHCFAAM